MNEAYTDDQIITAIDQVMEIMDKNNDGFITYSEYRFSAVDRNRQDDYPNGKPNKWEKVFW